MKKGAFIVLCLLLSFTFISCGIKKKEDKKEDKYDYTGYIGTMGEYQIEKDPEKELLTLDRIYFPEGLLETGLGLYIWDPTGKKWVRTNTPEGKALFRPDKSIMCFAHGMGGNDTADCPDEYYNAGYNTLSFMWGTFSDEDNLYWQLIADKIWYRECTRWIRIKGDRSIEEEDIPSATVVEIYGAFYYDLLSAFPEYSGKQTMIYGHSYGGMLTGGMISFLCSSYKNGYLPAYMLPTRVDFLDPYFSRTYAADYYVPWLGEATPNDGNMNEAIYQAVLDCKKLGIAVGLVRTSKSVCWPTTMNEFGTDITGSYWNFCNNIVYAHISDANKSVFPHFNSEIHGYGWSWLVDYYTEKVLTDASAEVEEEAYCFYMPYEKMFAKAGIKYEFDVNNTLRNVEDDILTSFFCSYDTEINDSLSNESPEILERYTEGKAKIAGFAYVDRNDNGVLDEQLKDHFAGVRVTIKDAAGTVIYDDYTSINGYYEAETNTAGEYTVFFDAPKGYSLSETEKKVTVVDTQRQVAINNVIVGK